ncbi:hypothetical protein [Tumidithrix helvetica]|uniref:hypothetical protein n=1 Tax=Tumidithrix helvetica TaxID=3457545 RepID=UPI003CC6AA02
MTTKPEKGQDEVAKPSTEWPFQRFSWTDHDANTGDIVSYRVIPVIRNKNQKLELWESHASDWSQPKLLGTNQGSFKPFFNRGFVISQFMAKFLAEQNLSLKKFKDRISEKDDRTIREFLSGDLRLALLKQLKTALKEKTEIFAVLFELSDNELIDALCAIGNKAHLVLANGSISKRKEESTQEARLRDENKEARQKLKDAGVDVENNNRFTAPGPLGHNKFLVRLDKKGKPAIAWTGSTNWSPTGLCTQNRGKLRCLK